MKMAGAMLALLLATAVLAGCGDDGETTGTGETTSGETTSEFPGAKATIEIEADSDDLAYTTETVSAEAEDEFVTVDFTNPQSTAHNVRVENAAGKTVGGTQLFSEGRDSATVRDMKPGRYTFYCSVPGHREAGMEGTLIVK